MICLIVFYGYFDLIEEFDCYYEEVYFLLVWKILGFQGWMIGKCVLVIFGQDLFYYLIVGIYFDFLEVMNESFVMLEGQVVIVDVFNFVIGGVLFMMSDEQVLIFFVMEVNCD